MHLLVVLTFVTLGAVQGVSSVGLEKECEYVDSGQGLNVTILSQTMKVFKANVCLTVPKDYQRGWIIWLNVEGENVKSVKVTGVKSKGKKKGNGNNWRKIVPKKQDKKKGLEGGTTKCFELLAKTSKLSNPCIDAYFGNKKKAVIKPTFKTTPAPATPASTTPSPATPASTTPEPTTDVDECKENPDICGDNSYCVNTFGSYNCPCNEGYYKDGNKCVELEVSGSPTEFNTVQVESVLGEHNEYRSMEQATGMMQLQWDLDLAASAQQAASLCTFGHTTSPWPENLTTKFGNYIGENIYVTTARTFTPADPVTNWANEKSDYDFTNNVCADNAMCGHYTQVVWDSTTHVGCGVAKCDQISGWNNNEGYMVFCQYGPAGNMNGKRPFTEGAPCSDCPAGSSCQTIPKFNAQICAATGV